MQGRTSTSSLPANGQKPASSPPPADNARDEGSVKYVVPKKEKESDRKEEHELKVWVSTSEGLKPVAERQMSNASSR